MELAATAAGLMAPTERRSDTSVVERLWWKSNIGRERPAGRNDLNEEILWTIDFDQRPTRHSPAIAARYELTGLAAGVAMIRPTCPPWHRSRPGARSCWHSAVIGQLGAPGSSKRVLRRSCRVRRVGSERKSVFASTATSTPPTRSPSLRSSPTDRITLRDPVAGPNCASASRRPAGARAGRAPQHQGLRIACS